MVIRRKTYLGNQDDDDEEDADPRAPDAAEGLEWDLVKGVVDPGLAEPDVRKADGAPGKERSKTRELEEPVEDGLTGSGQVHVGEAAHQENDGNGEQRTSGAVNVCENLGGVALLGEGSKGTGSTVNTGHTDGDD